MVDTLRKYIAFAEIASALVVTNGDCMGWRTKAHSSVCGMTMSIIDGGGTYRTEEAKDASEQRITPGLGRDLESILAGKRRTGDTIWE